MRTTRHRGHGQYEVLDDAGRVVAGPMPKDKAVAFLDAPPVRKGQMTKAEILESDRAYQRKVEADLAKPLNEELAELRNLLAKRRDQDEVEILIRAFQPILKAGKQGVRRERRYMLIPP